MASTASSGCWSSGHGGGVAPAGSGRGGGVGELREVEMELMEGSARAEGWQRGGLTVSLCSPACGGRRRRSGVWGWGNGKRMRGTGCGATCSASTR